MTEPCNDEGCVQGVHQLERSLCELEEASNEGPSSLYYPLTLDDFPLEIIALIADFVYDTHHKYAHLGFMMLVSRSFYDGVSLSKSWRVVNEVVTHVDDVAERRKVLYNRTWSLTYASTRWEHDHLLRYLRLSRMEALGSVADACRSGRLECVRYLVETFNMEVDEVCGCWDNCFSDACMNGHLPVIRYLHTKLGMTADDARAYENLAIYAACKNGHLAVIQYLHGEFALTADDARTNDNAALLVACKNGSIPVVKFLHSAFGLTADDARTNDNAALRVACKNGLLPVVKFLHSTFGLTADDARAADNASLCIACSDGDLPMVQYLHTEFGLTVDDARNDDNEAFWRACHLGHLPVVQYLHTGFGLMTGDPRDNVVIQSCIYNAREKGFEDVVQYLASIIE